MKEYKNALNNLAEFMKGLQEENQKLKDENKELKRKVDALLNGIKAHAAKTLVFNSLYGGEIDPKEYDLWSVVYDIDRTKPAAHALTIKATFDSEEKE